MLGPGRYLLGVLELAVLLVPAWLGAARVRGRLVPGFEGAAAWVGTVVLVVALLVWAGEVLGSFGLFEPVPYLVLVAGVGLGVRFFLPLRQPEDGTPHPTQQVGVGSAVLRRDERGNGLGKRGGGLGGEGTAATLVALLIATIAVVHFAGGVKTRLSTGMTGFDSTWYHGPFAAGFFQGGDTWELHFIAPQFLAWFYPANSELLHAVGMLAFGRDLVSPLLNLGWLVACLVACWAIGRPYRVAPWSLSLGAIALSVPALADQAGEARNDIVGIFFLLAAVAVVLNAGGADALMPGMREEVRPQRTPGIRGVLPTGALLVAGLAAGLAAGTKLNFLLPGAVLVLGLGLMAPRGARLRALAAAGLAALAGGGYWYLRNLVHTGNPLPWVHHLGPISLPSPGQTLGGREAHSVAGYLFNGSVWSDWFLPALHGAFWIVWPLLGLGALAGLLFCFWPGCGEEPNRDEGAELGDSALGAGQPWLRRLDAGLAIGGLVGLAVALAWLVAPTSASGPDGSPRGFESGLRYLAPALVLGLALLPCVPILRRSLARLTFPSHRHGKVNHAAEGRGAPSLGRPWAVMMWIVLGVVAVIALYPVQRHYLQDRYKDPSFTTPGLNAAFAWARDVSGARIATTSTRQYPLFGTDLSNHVQYLGEETAHGGFVEPSSCREFLRLVIEGDYDYVVASLDRIEAGKAKFPPSAGWLEAAGAKPLLREAPTVVFRLDRPLDPATCSG